MTNRALPTARAVAASQSSQQAVSPVPASIPNAALRAENKRLREALLMAHHSVGDLRRGFAKSVDPERWVEQLQAVTGAALSKQEGK